MTKRFWDRWGYWVATRRGARNGRFRPLAHAIAGALMLVAQTGWVLAQSAAILPQAKTQFLDQNGKPLVGGKVFTFVPNTTVPKTTWSDAFQANPNTNPIVLDAAGSAFIFGQGNYLQQLYDANNNLKWFGFTQAPGTLVPSGGSAQDTAPIGTVVPFAGSAVPTNWLLAFGQTISRTTYSQLLASLTISTTAGVCSVGSPNIGGFGDTSQIAVGQPVEASCLPGGTTVLSIVNASTIQASANANATTTVTVTVFPWGNGNGVNTFNVPDLRGRAVAGADAMGGTAAGRLTSAGLGSSAATPAISGGNQLGSLTVSQANLPNVNFTVSGITLNDPGHTHTNLGGTQFMSTGGFQSGVSGGQQYGNPQATTASATTGITVSSQGHAASGGSGTAMSFPTVQPTTTVNYIIKALPATSGAGGVVSLGGMFGDIVCDSSMTCATVGGVNTIGVNFPVTVPHGGTGQTVFSANLPIVGNGSGALAQGTVSGSGTKFATVTGSLSNGNCITASGGNLVDGGAPCVSATSGVSAGNAGQLAGYAVNGSIVSGFSPGIPITRAQIPTITANLQQFTVTGFRTAGDLGAGATYNCVGQTANSLMAIQDASSNWCALVIPNGVVNVGWFGAYADDGGHQISGGDVTANPAWRGIYSAGFNFTGSISGQTLTVTATSGVLGPSQVINGTGLTTGTFIIKQLTGSVGSTGTYKVNNSLSIASEAMTTSSQSWDYVATQEAIFAAFAPNSTPKTVVWNAPASTNFLNSTLVIPRGQFGINAQLSIVATDFTIWGAGKGLSQWDWVGQTGIIMVMCNSCAYFSWYNPTFQNNAGQRWDTVVPTVDLDHTSDSPGGLSTQQGTFYDMWLSVGQNGQGLAGNYIAGNSGQGDTIKFINPIIIGNTSDWGIQIVGDNTLDWGFFGGDCQGFYHKCIEAPGGSYQVYNMNFENQTGFFGQNGGFSPRLDQITSHGADMAFDWGVSPETSGIHMVRTESNIVAMNQFSSARFDIENVIVAGTDVLGYFNSFGGYIQGDMVAGGTKGWGFMLVDNGIDGSGTQSWRTMSPTITGCCTITDSGASYTVNALVGMNFDYRFGSNGFYCRVGIVSNTATTITTASACYGGGPIPSTSLYQVTPGTSNTPPNWDSATRGGTSNNEGSGGYGFFTSAGDIHVGAPSNDIENNVSVGDYVVIPWADILDPGSGAPSYIFPLYAKILAKSASPCAWDTTPFTTGCLTLSRAPARTQTGLYGFYGTPISDPVNTSMKWMNVNYASVYRPHQASSINIPWGGLIVNATGALTDISPSRVDWCDTCGSLTSLAVASGSFKNSILYDAEVAWGTQAGPTLNILNPANLQTATFIGSSTINLPKVSPQDGTAITGNAEIQLHMASNGGINKITWGTNVAAGTKSVILSANAAPNGVMIKFRRNPAFNNGWVEVERSQSLTQDLITTSPFSKGNDTSLQDITGLATVDVAVGVTYRFRALLYISSLAAAGGTKVAIGGTATATNIVYSGWGYDSGGVIRGYAQATALASPVASTTGWNSTNPTIEIEGTITPTASGTLTVQFAQNTANGTPSVVGVGSTFTVTQMN